LGGGGEGTGGGGEGVGGGGEGGGSEGSSPLPPLLAPAAPPISSIQHRRTTQRVLPRRMNRALTSAPPCFVHLFGRARFCSTFCTPPSKASPSKKESSASLSQLSGVAGSDRRGSSPRSPPLRVALSSARAFVMSTRLIFVVTVTERGSYCALQGGSRKNNAFFS